MKTVPFDDGHVPLRGSKNPVLGVFRHHCGQIASVHQPKGRRSNTRYLVCDDCGTDQCGGKPYQEKISQNTYHTIEALEAAEQASQTANDTANADTQIKPIAKPINEPTAKPLTTAPSAAYTANDEPLKKQTSLAASLTASLSQKKEADKPLDTAPHAAQTVNQPLETVTTDLADDLTENLAQSEPLDEPLAKPLTTTPSAVHTAKTIAPRLEPKPNDTHKQTVNKPLNQAPNKPAKPMRIGIAAIIGGTIGALLAAVA
ncbi:MAG: hypothetical protein BM565_12615 [Gammaproteobacteria bacterium MedPE]|nr:MAG: hypothetical protein BM565_12615 [Gammaproteobacteria bacterium MedPE]